jgi:hypothetical protein
MIQTLAYNLIGIVLTWFAFCTGLWVICLLYSAFTYRSKVIQLQSICGGLGLQSHYLVDEKFNSYYVESNHVFGSNDLINKISKLQMNKYYQITIYGFDSPITKVKLIDIKSC